MQKQQVQDINPNVLVESKKEWLNDLKDILIHSIQSEFVGIWDDCKKTGQKTGTDVHKLFISTLKEIKNCNDRKLEEHCAAVLKENNCQEEDFVRRLSCVFVAYGKVLLSVKITPGTSRLNLTIPKPKNFIHSVCIESAEQICQIPELFDDREIDNMTLFNNRKEIENIIAKSIETVIRRSLPINEISKDALITTPLPTAEQGRISVVSESHSEIYTESDMSEYVGAKKSIPRSKYKPSEYRHSEPRSSMIKSEYDDLKDLHSISEFKFSESDSKRFEKKSIKKSIKKSMPRESIHASVNDLLDNDDIKTIPVVKDTRRGIPSKIPPPPPPVVKPSNKSMVSQDIEAERAHNSKMRASVRPSDRINKARHDALFPE